jgi:hypothetical protein
MQRVYNFAYENVRQQCDLAPGFIELGQFERSSYLKERMIETE